MAFVHGTAWQRWCRSEQFNYTRDHIRTRLRLDGFAYLAPKDPLGVATVLTRPFALCALGVGCVNQLLLNVDAKAGTHAMRARAECTLCVCVRVSECTRARVSAFLCVRACVRAMPCAT
jgi:hypothetical protein